MEHHRFFFDKQAYDRREKLLAMPLKEIPAQELQEYGRFALQEIDRAARLDNPDWQILLKAKSDGVGLLLPDVQEMRGLARAMQVRFRAEVALRRFDDALRTAKTMFAMARHLGEHPTLISNLVGLAIASFTIIPLEELLEQPGCPNLYWALTCLPTPLIPINMGLDGERTIVLAEFRDLDDTAAMNSDQLKKFIAHMDKLLGDEKPAKPRESRLRTWLDARNKKEETVRAARRRLVEVGLPEERLTRFPADQILLLDEKREYEVRRDDEMKFWNLPIRLSEANSSQAKPKPEEMLFADLLPGLHNVHRAQGRVEQRIALVRHVEALRMYAAAHNGSLPAKLCEISVPLPDDPFTGKPFRYELSGATGHLRGTPPPGMEKMPAFNVHYEVTIQN
jgi:hypothetical protein